MRRMRLRNRGWKERHEIGKQEEARSVLFWSQARVGARAGRRTPCKSGIEITQKVLKYACSTM